MYVVQIYCIELINKFISFNNANFCRIVAVTNLLKGKHSDFHASHVSFWVNLDNYFSHFFFTYFYVLSIYKYL